MPKAEKVNINMDKFVKVRCKKCSKIFLKNEGHYKENLKLGHNFYCSRNCELKYKTKERKILKCENCGKKFTRTPHAISPHNYCSCSCAAIVSNGNRPERGAKTIKCKNCGKKFKKWITNNNKKYCSKYCRIDAEFYTVEKVLEIIKKTASRLKRTPARRELSGGVIGACVRFFGSWNKAISVASLIPNRSHDDRMYKRANAKAVDGHFCDSVSELLIDNWFYRNGISHERNYRYPETHHKTDWVITVKNQRVFVEYFGLVNDSPRYDKATKKKIDLCAKHKISLISIYPKDLYPKTSLEDNLKEKFKNFLIA